MGTVSKTFVYNTESIEKIAKIKLIFD